MRVCKVVHMCVDMYVGMRGGSRWHTCAACVMVHRCAHATQTLSGWEGDRGCCRQGCGGCSGFCYLSQQESSKLSHLQTFAWVSHMHIPLDPPRADAFPPLTFLSDPMGGSSRGSSNHLPPATITAAPTAPPCSWPRFHTAGTLLPGPVSWPQPPPAGPAISKKASEPSH